ncbi:glycylpeptide N-tetradecanoyltransferase NMT1 [Sporobolomyces koalae]|uniref:glycylpeptide N-tetradecanoyltransferase NMT1 n=1 Tax=Sporobolomyces koalae TaxID=500713 RepID=UPI00316FF050
MQDSGIDSTANALERALVDTLARSKLESDSEPAADTSSPADEDPSQDQDAYRDGDLPEFSDPEPEHDEPSTAASSSGPIPKLVPGRAMKGPAGRKKLPLSALKQRIAGVASSGAAKKSEPSSVTAPAPTAAKPTKGKGKALKMTDEQLDMVITRFTADKPELEGKVSREDMLHMIELLQIDEDTLKGNKGLMGKGTKDTGSHKFWRTQPVAQDPTAVEELREGPLEADKKPEEIRKEPIDLHKDFKWVTIDLNNPNELKEVYELLTHHYVEDADASFRFDYAAEFIEWALKPPGYVPDWHVGIRVAASDKLVGFIAGIPVDLRIRTVTKRCTEINFLVVHKKLRSKRLAPLLIQEVTRRTHLRGIFQAIYTSGTVLPTPFTRCQYYHRNLNPSKLVKLGFSAVPRNSTVARMATYYRVPNETTIPGLREIEKRDLKRASRLLRAYLARFDCAPMLSNKEVEHALWSGRGVDVAGKRTKQVVWTYVVEDPETHRITDLFSLYSLPSTAVKSKPLQAVNAAYLFYYASDATPSTSDLGDGSTATKVVNWKEESPEQRAELKKRLNALIHDAMICSQKLGFDVLNALTLQDNAMFLENLKFGRGDGFLNFYLYNYHTRPIEGGIDPAAQGSGIGVVML